MSRLTKRENGELYYRQGENYAWSKPINKGNVKYPTLSKLAHYEDLEEQGKLAEVIRCKDCIRYGDEYVVGAGWCDEHEHLTNDDDYCSYAVARLAEMEGVE